MGKLDIKKILAETVPSEDYLKQEKFFIGIDPSLTGNAIVIINDKAEIIHEDLITSDKECYINGAQRVLDVFDQTKYIVNVARLEKIYIEDLAYTATSPTLFERCGLLFLIQTYLLRKDVNYSTIPPTELKKWHTTYGHADKDLMMKVAKCKWDIDFQDDNICDAYCLAMLALEDWKNNVKRG